MGLDGSGGIAAAGLGRVAGPLVSARAFGVPIAPNAHFLHGRKVWRMLPGSTPRFPSEADFMSAEVDNLISSAEVRIAHQRKYSCCRIRFRGQHESASILQKHGVDPKAHIDHWGPRTMRLNAYRAQRDYWLAIVAPERPRGMRSPTLLARTSSWRLIQPEPPFSEPTRADTSSPSWDRGARR
jgi:hypothetical protein